MIFYAFQPESKEIDFHKFEQVSDFKQTFLFSATELSGESAFDGQMLTRQLMELAVIDGKGPGRDSGIQKLEGEYCKRVEEAVRRSES